MIWNGLTKKLLLGVILIEVIMLSMLVYNSVRLLSSTHAELFERTVNEEITLLGNLLLSGLSARDRALINDNLQLISNQANLEYATVYDRKSQLMAKVGHEPANFITDKNFQQAEADGIYDIEFDIKLGQQSFGFLRAGFSIKEIQILSKQARLQNTGIALVEIVLSISVTIVAGIYLMRRITTLQKGANALQQGKFDYRIPVINNDELGELASAFNQLGESLSLSQHQLLEKQQQLQREASRLSSLLNSVNAIIFEAKCDPFEICYINEEATKLLGYPVEQWKQSYFLTTIAHPDDVSLLKQFIQSPESQTHQSFDYRVKNNKGEIIWLRHMANVEHSETKRLVHGILIDVTEEKHNLELQRARDIALAENRTKSAFLASMSHELRTPLNAIIGYSEIISDDIANGSQIDSEQVNSDLNRIIRSGKHLLLLINEILDLSKINAGKFRLTLSHFKSDRLISDIADMIRPLAEKHHNTLVIQAQSSFTIYTDYQKLYQVAINLCSNACKFTKNGTIEVTIQLTQEVNYFVISVKDTGIGIKPEDMKNLFTEFSRTEAAAGIEGTGLGLCLSQKLCQLMGGEIRVTSEYGTGSTFRAVLPIETIADKVA